MTANEREWLEQFEAFFDETGLAGVSCANIRTLIRLAKEGDDGPGIVRDQEWQDELERQAIIGKVEAN